MSESQIAKMKFSFLSSTDILSLSTVAVTNPVAFDKNANPSLNGLYDPAMGVSPFDRKSKCYTCGQTERYCPGHSGHITLQQPVFNVFYINEVVKLMRAKCFFCHRFTTTKSKIDDFCILYVLNASNLVLKMKNICKIAVFKLFVQKSEQNFFG